MTKSLPQIQQDARENIQDYKCGQHRLLIPAIESIIQQAYTAGQQETAKAYGGCTSCYGKGYSTELRNLVGAEDFGGEGFETGPLKSYIFCTKCARGQQIAELIKAGEQKGRDDEKQILLNSFQGSLQRPHLCIWCGKPSKITWEQAINVNAIGGRCFECATSQPATTAARTNLTD